MSDLPPAMRLVIYDDGDEFIVVPDVAPGYDVLQLAEVLEQYAAELLGGVERSPGWGRL